MNHTLLRHAVGLGDAPLGDHLGGQCLVGGAALPFGHPHLAVADLMASGLVQTGEPGARAVRGLEQERPCDRVLVELQHREPRGRHLLVVVPAGRGLPNVGRGGFAAGMGPLDQDAGTLDTLPVRAAVLDLPGHAPEVGQLGVEETAELPHLAPCRQHIALLQRRHDALGDALPPRIAAGPIAVETGHTLREVGGRG